MSTTKKFNFSKELKADLAKNSKSWDDLLFKACLEAKEAGIKATEFADALRKSGFRCGTGPARSAYKAVRDGKDQKGMITAIMAVKAKRKGTAKATTATTGDGTDGKDAGKATNKDAGTLVGALQAALAAAKAGHIEVVETWLDKARAILATAKLSTAQAIEKMGGIVVKAS